MSDEIESSNFEFDPDPFRDAHFSVTIEEKIEAWNLVKKQKWGRKSRKTLIGHASEISVKNKLNELLRKDESDLYHVTTFLPETKKLHPLDIERTDGKEWHEVKSTTGAFPFFGMMRKEQIGKWNTFSGKKWIWFIIWNKGPNVIRRKQWVAGEEAVTLESVVIIPANEDLETWPEKQVGRRWATKVLVSEYEAAKETETPVMSYFDPPTHQRYAIFEDQYMLRPDVEAIVQPEDVTGDKWWAARNISND